MKKNRSLGLYNTALFEVQINTIDDNIIEKMSPSNTCIFFHEYIHFLQDFTTYYGLHHVYCYSEYIHEVVNMIYKNISSGLSLPVKNEQLHPNVALNIELKDSTLGDVNATFEHIDIKSIEITMKKVTIPNNEVHEIICVDVYDEKESFTFGQFAIKESMAYLMEQLTMPEVYEKSSDYPYNSAKKVAEYYNKEFAEDKLKILALCDMSLMFSNPAEVFVDFMEKVKSLQVKVESPENVYNYFYDQNDVDGNSHIIKSYREIAETVRSRLKSYINDYEPDTKAFYDWVDGIIDEGIQLRTENKYWLLDMARGGHLFYNQEFKKKLLKLGSPLIQNKLGHYYAFPNQSSNNNAVAIFAIILQILNLFMYGKVECRLYQWCVSSNIDVDDRCKTSPWERCNSMNLCPYAQVWIHWNLKDYAPNLSKSNMN